MKILFLEDDPIIADIVIEFLQSQKFSVDYAFDIGDLEQLLSSNSYDIYIFDVNVPDGNSFEFLNYIRSIGDNTPTIFITALQSIDDLKKGFASGCDDYIKKPFELEELSLRLNNIKRLYHLEEKVKIDSEIILDKSRQLVIVSGKEYKIREKELQILCYLSHHENHIVSTTEFIQNIWKYDSSITDATIRTYVKNLRQLIGNNKIETIKGVGYRFIKS